MMKGDVVHPCKGLSRRQKDAFEQVAIGNSRIHPKTAEVLIEHGLIVKEMVTVARDRFGLIQIPEYHVPVPLHWQWCEWCAEQDHDHAG